MTGSILMVLARSTQPLSGREVHRLSGAGSREGVRKALHRLTLHGLVHCIDKRGTNLFTLNRDHLAAPAVDVLTSMRRELIERTRRAVASWAIQPVHLSMFGSMARGDGGVESDIDLLLVRARDIDPLDPSWEGQVGALREAMVAWTGNHVSCLEQAEEELGRLLASGTPFLRQWQLDAIDLGGVSVLDLVEKPS